MVKPKPIKPKVNPSFYLPNSFSYFFHIRSWAKKLQKTAKIDATEMATDFFEWKGCKKTPWLWILNKHQPTSKTWTPFKNIKSPTRSLKVQFGPAKFGVRIATNFFSGHIKILKSVIVSIVMFQISRYQLRFPISLLTVRINA